MVECQHGRMRHCQDSSVLGPDSLYFLSFLCLDCVCFLVPIRIGGAELHFPFCDLFPFVVFCDNGLSILQSFPNVET